MLLKILNNTHVYNYFKFLAINRTEKHPKKLQNTPQVYYSLSEHKKIPVDYSL